MNFLREILVSVSYLGIVFKLKHCFKVFVKIEEV